MPFHGRRPPTVQCTTLPASRLAETGATWHYWNSTYVTTSASTTTTISWDGWCGWNAAYEETRKQRAAREQAEQRERVARARERHDAAKARALALLGEFLTPEQLAAYRERNGFEVRGSDGGRYRIRPGSQSGNVQQLGDDGVPVASFCAHPPGSLPDADAHLAQMLALVTDEIGFRRVANCYAYHPADPVARAA